MHCVEQFGAVIPAKFSLPFDEIVAFALRGFSETPLPFNRQTPFLALVLHDESYLKGLDASCTFGGAPGVLGAAQKDAAGKISQGPWGSS
jgi:hypothetical protein